MGAHARFAKLCAVGGVAASFALVKGVEKRREGKLLLTEKGLGGSTSTSSSQLLNTRKPAWQVAAKEVHVDQGFQGVKWDSNWDKRDPASLVKPLKESATDEEKAAREVKLAENKPKASRILVLVRHGQYNLDGTQDSERYLTELGQKQAAVTGQRLGELYARYLQKLDENGNKSSSGKIRLVKSTMTRATETANIILKQLPVEIDQSSCDLIREGAPCIPEPPLEDLLQELKYRMPNEVYLYADKLEQGDLIKYRQRLKSWSPDPCDFFQEGARIEAGFRKYFHRAEPSQEETSVDILVCHGNVIRYCVCRALQLDPQAWLRMAVHNGSITVLVIKPSGRVSLLELGGAGHFDSEMLTFN